MELIGYGTIYPDFTILDSKNMCVRYLEHFGRMDDMQYCEKAIKKINLYGKNGFMLGDKLLATYETSTLPLDMRVVSVMLEKIFK